MRFAVGKLLLVACFLVPGIASAQNSGAEVTAGANRFLKASLGIWNWVKTFDAEADQFVTKENRHQLIDQLRKLNKSIYEVESAKLSLLYEMTHTTGSPDELKQMDTIVVDLVTKVTGLKSTIGDVASLLREQRRAGGEECEQLLTEAILERKEWVSELSRNPDLLRNPVTRAQVIASGESAVKALRNASIELSKVIDRLSNSQ
jgi:hypothetical protein